MSVIAHVGTYEPPLTEEGSPLIPGEEKELAPGVLGYAILAKGRIHIPLIIAAKEGSGAVGRFLDSLTKRCVIPSVTSPRLMGMLARRGWIPVWYEDQDSPTWEKP